MTKLSHSEDASMTAEKIHTCSYSCERPGCIRAQRDELVARLEALTAAQRPEARGGGEAAPPSASVGVDFAAVASILRRAMRDGAHYGYRRDFILQQALALEALSQQPAVVDGPDTQSAEIEALRAEVEGLHEQLRLATVDQVNAEAEANDARSENERLAEALRVAREYVVSELAAERDKFAGYEHCSNIASIEADLAKIDAAIDRARGEGEP
ncbi:MAG TPA: hypothetical protein VIK75_03805 [Calditerricola sp.]